MSDVVERLRSKDIQAFFINRANARMSRHFSVCELPLSLSRANGCKLACTAINGSFIFLAKTRANTFIF